MGYNMRSRQCGWIMPEDDIPSVLQMIEDKIASPEIKFQHQHALIRLRDILEVDRHRIRSQASPNMTCENSQQEPQDFRTCL